MRCARSIRLAVLTLLALCVLNAHPAAQTVEHTTPGTLRRTLPEEAVCCPSKPYRQDSQQGLFFNNNLVLFGITGFVSPVGGQPGVAHAADLVESRSSTAASGGYVRVPFDPTRPSGSTLTLQTEESALTLPVAASVRGEYTISITPTRYPSTSIWSKGKAKVTVRNRSDNSPARGLTVNFSTVNKNGGSGRQPLTSGNTGGALHATQRDVTDTNGEVAYTNNGGIPGTLTITASLAANSGITDSLDMRFGPPQPAGFITGPAYSTNNGSPWSDASAICQAQGGQLPTVAQLQAIAGLKGDGSYRTSGWPLAYYWTGEVKRSGHATVTLLDGLISWDYDVNSRRVVCVR